MTHATSEKLYTVVSNLLESYSSSVEILLQEELDLNKNRNTNLFAYRGQFSPDFISNLLKYYSKKGDVIFDPFVGSGTVLFEAARKNLSAFGSEINPAAYEMAKTSIFLPLDESKRSNEIKKALRFTNEIDPLASNEALYKLIESKIKKSRNLFLQNLLKNALISLLGSKKPHTKESYLKFINKHAGIVLALPQCSKKVNVFLTDTRKVPLKTKSVNLIITSPPYINVFNYHQHNRTFIDRVYGNALLVAKSEFGANRKHRQNRFLTATQYILDMVQAFEEMSRTLKTNGRLIMVIGKTSKIRGVNFRNDYIIAGVASIVGYKLVSKQERKFINQFGETIYEEILHFTPPIQLQKNTEVLARNFATNVLKVAKQEAKDKIISEDIEDAIQKVSITYASPLL